MNGVAGEGGALVANRTEMENIEKLSIVGGSYEYDRALWGDQVNFTVHIQGGK